MPITDDEFHELTMNTINIFRFFLLYLEYVSMVGMIWMMLFKREGTSIMITQDLSVRDRVGTVSLFLTERTFRIK